MGGIIGAPIKFPIAVNFDNFQISLLKNRVKKTKVLNLPKR